MSVREAFGCESPALSLLKAIVSEVIADIRITSMPLPASIGKKAFVSRLSYVPFFTDISSESTPQVVIAFNISFFQ